MYGRTGGQPVAFVISARQGWRWKTRGRTAAGRVEIESKEDAMKRGQSSPHRAEALVLALPRVVPRHQTETWSAPYTVSPI